MRGYWLVQRISAPALRTCAGFRLHIRFTKCERSCEGSDVRLTCSGSHMVSTSVVCGCNSGHLDGPMQRFELSHTSGAFELPDHAIADNPDTPLDRIVSDTMPTLPAHAPKVLRLGCAGCRLGHILFSWLLGYQAQLTRGYLRPRQICISRKFRTAPLVRAGSGLPLGASALTWSCCSKLGLICELAPFFTCDYYGTCRKTIVPV